MPKKAKTIPLDELPSEPADTTGCQVCAHPAREVIEQMLSIGYAYWEVAKELALSEDFRRQIRDHHFGKHIGQVTREGYLFMLISYAQNIRVMEKREKALLTDKQNQKVFDRVDSGMRYVMSQIARMEGYDRPPETQKNDIKGLLERLANNQPDMARRIAASRKPLEITAEPAKGN